MNAITLDKVLVQEKPVPAGNIARVTAEVAKRHGINPFRQLGDVLRHQFGKTKLAPHEYFAARLYRDELTPQDRAEYVGEASSLALNQMLAPRTVAPMWAFLRDKVTFTAMLRQLSIPTTRTQAVVSEERLFGAIPVLRNSEEIEAFLTTEARYPLFCKPGSGRGSVGSARIDAYDSAAGMLRIGNGGAARPADFAKEVMQDYPEGFMFQSAVEQHPELSRIAGPALGTIRVVTVVPESGVPRILYTVWKIPSPNAMSDNYWQKGTMIAHVEPHTGEVLRCQRGTSLNTEEIDIHPVSGKRITGYKIPHWRSVVQTALTTHAIFPSSGVLGWDIGIGPEGAVIIECNDNPIHTLYQFAADRGVRNEDFEKLFESVQARNKILVQRRKAERRAATRRFHETNRRAIRAS